MRVRQWIVNEEIGTNSADFYAFEGSKEGRYINNLTDVKFPEGYYLTFRVGISAKFGTSTQRKTKKIVDKIVL